MTQTPSAPTQFSPEIVGGLIETVSVALLDRFPFPSANLDDIDDVIESIRVLKPKLAEIDLFAGMNLMLRGQWDEAARVITALIEARPDFEPARALLAFYYTFKGGEDWRQVIGESKSPEIVRFVEGLTAQSDMLQALRTAVENGTPLEIPASASAFVESVQPSPSTTLHA